MDGELAGRTPRYLGPPVDPRGVLRKPQFDFGRAESLAVLAPEYEFFVPGALYVHGWFGDAPLVDHMHALGRDVTIWHYRFNQPVAQGLETAAGDLDWNHVLWAVRRDEWPPLLDFICSLTIANRPGKFVVRYGQQVFGIHDPLALERGRLVAGNAPQVALISFLGIYSSRATASFLPGPAPLLPPKLVFSPPDPAAIAMADAYFAGRNLLDAHEQARKLHSG